MNAPLATLIAPSAVGASGSGPVPASSRSEAFATTGKALEAGARWHGLGQMSFFVNVVPNSKFIALVTKVQRVIKWLTLPSSGQPRGTGFAAQVKR
jgi:hypothetical protein